MFGVSSKVSCSYTPVNESFFRTQSGLRTYTGPDHSHTRREMHTDMQSQTRAYLQTLTIELQARTV